MPASDASAGPGRVSPVPDVASGPRPSTGESTPVVEVVEVSRRYKNVVALDGVSLTVNRGEFFSLLGSSGCGKTTLLRIVGGFETPSEGDLRLHGRSVVNEPPFLRRTNMIFQHLALFPHLDVQQNVAFGLEVKGLQRPVIKRKVDAMLALVRLEGLQERRIDQLSGGQKQRVAIARALVNEPEVLLLDEPFGALDLQLRLQMQVELRRLQRALNSTFIFVTHDQSEAITMSDRIAVMEHGRILQVGSPRDVYEFPEHRFVAEFLGHSNLLAGIVLGSAGNGLCAVSCGPLRLEARCRRPLAAGSSATIAVRYEKVEIGAAKDGGEGFRGRIVDLQYMGPLQRVEVQLADCDVLIRSDLPSTESSARLSVGQDVHAFWPCDAAVALPL